jgi:hypothetical protein
MHFTHPRALAGALALALVAAAPAEARLGDPAKPSIQAAKKARALGATMLLRKGRVVHEAWTAPDPRGWTTAQAMAMLKLMAGSRKVRSKGYDGDPSASDYLVRFADGARATLHTAGESGRFSAIEADAPGFTDQDLAKATAGHPADQPWRHGDIEMVVAP